MAEKKIDILLATYNGERFLEEQLDSLLAQTYPHFHLIIRDDVSSDGTARIIQKYAQMHANRIHVVPATSQLGPKGNFSELMRHSTANFIMFADQDDIWMPNKIADTLKVMIELSKDHPGLPLLVHSDLSLIDEKGAELSPSFWDYTHINPHKFLTINRLLTQNVVTGCTMMINRNLCDLAHPIPQDCFMHDWWIALVCATFGKIGIVNKPTILYRQHSSNTLGAKKFGSWEHFANRLANLYQDDETKRSQGELLLQRFSDRMNKAQIALIQDYINLKNTSLIKNRFLIFKHQFFKSGLSRNLVTLLTKKQP